MFLFRWVVWSLPTLCLYRVTGRWYGMQIRAQLAAIGTPIVGDSAYMTAAMAAIVNPSINPFGRWGQNYDSEDEKAAAVEAWISCHGKEPKSVIGLQASEISWDYEGEHHSYKAGVPWWRQDAVESDLIWRRTGVYENFSPEPQPGVAHFVCSGRGRISKVIWPPKRNIKKKCQIWKPQNAWCHRWKAYKPKIFPHPSKISCYRLFYISDETYWQSWVVHF